MPVRKRKNGVQSDKDGKCLIENVKEERLIERRKDWKCFTGEQRERRS